MGLDVSLLQALDSIGVVVFAVTGALAASRKELDLVGFVFLAAITGVGGGTLRDVILGETPVFWIREPQPVILCALSGVAVFFVAPFVEYRYQALLWADAIGISGYCVMGASRALDAGASPVSAVVMGVMTASFGGIIRDVIAGEPSVLLRKEIYVTATLVGATLFVLADRSGMPFWPAAFLGGFAAFGVRAGALRFGWTLPTYRSRPGREFPPR
ncbi:trimeric intracellular cation channel family protein [Mesorhizobium sp. BR1-1-16]|uniref:trimeric intracellular cation channel family protein n=1 Tax=Mesorhizobium sp. BR1-1-16 TaxID=2876653 RepID=UPI001CC94B8C|nr:trimeric intracellular cation channel family protein [Mesorhizobium sp. BR1-1-16]MBZ9938044.1 trimeric intracellular cation channel family protein [Mesorhizobium sp. BR1-1-16]HWJ72695.1 trimeric intracellular cation channel family protein [Kaistia sp.]